MVMRIKQTFYGWEYMEIGNILFILIYICVYMYDPTKLGVTVCLKIGCTPKNGIVFSAR